MPLRPYQEQAIADIRAAFRAGYRRVLFRGPTGMGKTEIFTFIARNAAPRGTRVGIPLHRRELLRQTCDRLHYPHGIINAGYRPDTSKLIQVGTVQTMVNRLDKYTFDLLILDEAHHCKARTWERIIEANPTAWILGVTATPERLDGRGLDDIFQTMIEGPTEAELISDGWLSDFDVYAPSPMATDGVHSKYGDYIRKELAAAVDKPRITGDAIQHYRRYADGLPALVFCVSVSHAYHVAEQFRTAGYRFVAVEAKTPDAEREAALADLASRRIHGVVNVDLFGEGVDVPVVECGIFLRPTQSLGLARQQMGRCLRTAPGKHRAIILDHAGNTLRHGLPDETIEWSLQGKPAREADDAPKVAIKQCPSCYYVHRPAPRCPSCGMVYQVKPREVEQVDGDLERVDPDPEQIARRREVGQARDRAALERIAKERGYKPGWVEYILRARGQRGRTKKVRA